MQSQTRVTGATLHAFIEQRRKGDERVFGIVDAGRDKELAFEGALRWGWTLRWLFGEDASPQLRDVAPYLVPIEYRPHYPYDQSEYLDLWADRLGGSAGILLLCGADSVAVWRHLRSVFVGADEEGKVCYSRFYDPRVFRGMLPELVGDQVTDFFGPVSGFVVEGENPAHLLTCRVGDGKVEMEEESLVPTD